jgi:homoserine O-acetyltransferase
VEHQIASLGDFRFENGEIVKDFKVSYVTHGKLNENKDNVILVMNYFAGDYHGFDFLIGPGKALDTDKYFIIATDCLGNTNIRQDLTTGPTNSRLKMRFPRYTLRDSVNLEYKLLKEYLGFDHILAVTGASMGATKSYQFTVSYPTYISGIIPIAGNPMTNPRQNYVISMMMNTIALDSGWYGGNYETNPTTGLITALMSFVSWLYTDEWFATNLKTPAEYRQWTKMWYDIWTFYAQDARDVYYQLQSAVDYNIGDTPGFNGDAQAALQSIKAQVLLINAKRDMIFPHDEILSAKEVIPKATHIEIDSPFGHEICCGSDPEATKIMDQEIAKFLSNLTPGIR